MFFNRFSIVFLALFVFALEVSVPTMPDSPPVGSVVSLRRNFDIGGHCGSSFQCSQYLICLRDKGGKISYPKGEVKVDCE